MATDAEVKALAGALKWAMRHIGEPRLVRGQNDEHYHQWHESKRLIEAAAKARPSDVRTYEDNDADK